MKERYADDKLGIREFWRQFNIRMAIVMRFPFCLRYTRRLGLFSLFVTFFTLFIASWFSFILSFCYFFLF